MEVGQTATAGPHYSKRWDTTASERDSYYAGESWKDSSSRKLGSTGTGVHPWTDVIGAPPSSTTTPSHSMLFSDGTLDKVLYQNLVEMIPLVETLMDQQNNKSFPRHASLIYTPTPSRDPLLLKKAVEQKGKRGHNHFFRGRRSGVVKDGFFWEDAENMYLDSRETHPEEIPMLSFPTDHQVDQNAVNKDIIARLQGQIEQLEQKLLEKDNQIQAAENSTHQQDDLLRLHASVEELKKRIASKEQEVQQALNQLSEKKHEVGSLQSLLQKAQAGLEASNLNVTKVQGELDNLQWQVASFILEMQKISLSFCHDAADPEHGLSLESAPWSEEDSRVIASQIQKSHGDVELTRRKYLACLIAARESPTEEVLLLVAELRAQLQNFLMQPDTIPGPIHDIHGAM